ncbi:MAG: hypothetical protein RLZ98_1076 [Pseudomonadota bacterium]|jgi:Xaa-Pro aminopeptidase
MPLDTEPRPDTATLRNRLSALRQAIERAGIDAFLIPRADEFQGEYVAPGSERIAWLTGFTGSAGTAVVGLKKAALFVDGRYTLQAPRQVDTRDFQVLQVPDEKLTDWLAANIGEGGKVGFDPWLHSISEIEALKEPLASAGVGLKPVARNLVDKVWGRERPPAPDAEVLVHPTRFAGQPADEKIAAVQSVLKKEGQDAVILTMPDSVCWLLNIRGRDVAHNPVVLAYAIVPRSGRATLFVSRSRLGNEVRAHLKPLAKTADPSSLPEHVDALRQAGKKVRLDLSRAPFWFQRRLGGRGRIAAGSDPCALPKARKNKTEIEGTRAAHQRDGAALCRFLSWLDRTAATGSVDELKAERMLENERAATGELIDLSFDTISAFGPNGALPHYRSTAESNRPLKSGDLYLVDSGAQYVDGTTDVTRTVAIGEPSTEMRRAFTAVLKGHIAIATARFPKGTRGVDLDPFARRALWQAGLDYDHGTGHGVGSFLSVHEGPAGISRRAMVPLEPGMILSNEPGYYKPDAFGIRIENLVLVKPLEPISGGEREMMGFEDLTLAPIDRHLIDVAALTGEERHWLDTYHARVYREIGPLLDPKDRRWLKDATAPL